MPIVPHCTTGIIEIDAAIWPALVADGLAGPLKNVAGSGVADRVFTPARRASTRHRCQFDRTLMPAEIVPADTAQLAADLHHRVAQLRRAIAAARGGR